MTVPPTLKPSGTPVTVSETVEVAWLSQVHVPLPTATGVVGVTSVLQLRGVRNGADSVTVALVTPPPTQPPKCIVAENTDDTVAEDARTGNGGLNTALPLAVAHEVPPAAPAGDAASPIGTTVAARRTTGASTQTARFQANRDPTPTPNGRHRPRAGYWLFTSRAAANWSWWSVHQRRRRS